MLSRNDLAKYCWIDGAIEIFGRLLEWSPERVIEWAQQFKIEHPWFQDEIFYWRVCDELIRLVPKSTLEKLNPEEILYLQQSFQGPLFPLWSGDKWDDIHWKIARYKIDTAIGWYDPSYIKDITIDLKNLEP